MSSLPSVQLHLTPLPPPNLLYYVLHINMSVPAIISTEVPDSRKASRATFVLHTIYYLPPVSCDFLKSLVPPTLANSIALTSTSLQGSTHSATISAEGDDINEDMEIDRCDIAFGTGTKVLLHKYTYSIVTSDLIRY